MKVKVARCPHCGARIKVDPDLEVATCRYCQMQYDVEPAIHAFEMEQETAVESGRQRVEIEENINLIKNISVCVKNEKDIQIYLDLRYEVVNKSKLDNGEIKVELQRDSRFDNKRLEAIETKILSVYEQEPNNKTLIEQEKKKWTEAASFMGLLG